MADAIVLKPGVSQDAPKTRKVKPQVKAPEGETVVETPTGKIIKLASGTIREDR